MQSKSIFQTLELLSTGKMRPWGVLSCIAFTLLIHSNLFALDWTNGATDNWNSSNWDGGAYTTNNNAYIDNGTLTIAAGENIQMGTGQLRHAKSASSSASAALAFVSAAARCFCAAAKILTFTRSKLSRSGSSSPRLLSHKSRPVLPSLSFPVTSQSARSKASMAPIL